MFRGVLFLELKQKFKPGVCVMVRSIVLKTTALAAVLVVAIAILYPAVAVSAVAAPNPATVKALIDSLNKTVSIAENLLRQYNVPLNSSAWDCLSDAKELLANASSAYSNGDYTSAFKYAMQGMAKAREAVVLGVREALSNPVLRNQTELLRARAKVIAAIGMVRGAFRMLNAAYNHKIINETLAEEVNATLVSDYKQLQAALLEINSAITNGTSVNLTSIIELLKKVAHDVAEARSVVSKSITLAMEERIRAMIQSRIAEMNKTIQFMLNEAVKARENGLNNIAEYLEERAELLEKKLQALENMTSRLTTMPVGFKRLIEAVSRLSIARALELGMPNVAKMSIALTEARALLPPVKELIRDVKSNCMGMRMMQAQLTSEERREVMEIENLTMQIENQYKLMIRAILAHNESQIIKATEEIGVKAKEIKSLAGKLAEELKSKNRVRYSRIISKLNKITDDADKLVKRIEAIKEKASKLAELRSIAPLIVELSQAQKTLAKAVVAGVAENVFTIEDVVKARIAQHDINIAKHYIAVGDNSTAVKELDNAIKILSELKDKAESKECSSVTAQLDSVITVLNDVVSKLS